MRKKVAKGTILEGVTVLDMADEGKSICKHEGIVYFINKGVPGDVVDIITRKKHKSFYEADVISVRQASPDRTTPFCQHFGVCGGCKWQHMQYTAQLQFKEKQVRDAFERIGKIQDAPVLPILGSDEIRYYRNKLDFSFASRRYLSAAEFEQKEIYDSPGLGFHIPGQFDKVLNIQECHLQPDPSNTIRNGVRQFAIDNDIPFFDIRKKHGILRSLILRNTVAGEFMVIVMVAEDNKQVIFPIMDYLKNSFTQISSLYYVVNTKANDTMHDLDLVLYSGNPFITESMDNLQFRISPKSFFQTNPKQALRLYRIAKEFARLTGNEKVYDLYTGTGTIANFVAGQSKSVTGIEYVADAVEDAKVNSAINNISNTDFYAGDLKDLLTEPFFNIHGKPDVIITDPPRAGMHEDVVRQILASGAQRIVYVSCNPATQARDISLLTEKYRTEKIQPVDMFPHTAHVESVALLTLKA